jgi:hypothetical protein
VRVSLLLFSACLLLPACAQQKVSTAIEVPVVAPTTAWIATREAPISSLAVLSGPDSDLFCTRPEKAVYGALPMAGIAAFSTYTYDAQNISNLGSIGYRYRWVVQDGISAPIAP